MKTSDELYDFASACMDLADEQGLTPQECVSALINAIAILAVAGVRPGHESEMLEVILGGVQEEYAAGLRHKSKGHDA